jgi:protease PrsW
VTSSKLIIPLAVLIFFARYRKQADGLLIGVAVGAGFAALETMGYAFVTLLQSKGSLGALDEVLLVRGLMSPAGHAAWTGLVCAVLWRERLKAGHAVLNLRVVAAFLTAVVLHDLWDTFNSLQGGAALLSLGVALASLVFLIRRVREADRALRA